MLENYPDIITIEDLCKILHIGRNKAYEFLNEKLIKSLKVGRKVHNTQKVCYRLS